MTAELLEGSPQSFQDNSLRVERILLEMVELFPNANDEREEDVKTRLSPKGQLLRNLVNLAVTIRDDGQVNTLTIVDLSQSITHLFRIETGE